MSNTISPPSLEEQLDRISNNEIDWKKVLEDFWVDFIGAVDRHQGSAQSRVLDALNDLLEPHIFPERADGKPRRQCPQCGAGELSLKTGRFGAFIGCSNYPDCNFTRQLTPSADGMNGTKVLGEDPATGLEVSLRSRPLRPLSAARRRDQGAEAEEGREEGSRRARPREAQARQPAQRRRARRYRSRKGAGAAGTAARSRPLARRRRADPRRGRPLRPLRQARQDLRQPGRRRRCSHCRAQPRGDIDRGQNRQSEKGPPLRRRSRQGAGRAPRQGRLGRGQERPLRTLRQPQRRQCHAHRRQDAGHGHPRRSGVPARRARRRIGQHAERRAAPPAASRLQAKPAANPPAKSAARAKKPAATKAKKPAAVAAKAKPARRTKAAAE